MNFSINRMPFVSVCHLLIVLCVGDSCLCVDVIVHVSACHLLVCVTFQCMGV